MVYADHNALAFLAKLNPTDFRLALVLQPYGLAAQHMAGKDNVLADVLSHMPVGKPL